jgi:hypothetical protein
MRPKAEALGYLIVGVVEEGPGLKPGLWRVGFRGLKAPAPSGRTGNGKSKRRFPAGMTNRRARARAKARATATATAGLSAAAQRARLRSR